MANMKFKIARVTPMPLERRRENGTIAVCELHIVLDVFCFMCSSLLFSGKQTIFVEFPRDI